MDIPEAVEEMQSHIDELEGYLDTAREEAQSASNYAIEAREQASNSETYADYCVGTVENAMSELSEICQAFRELQDRLEEEEGGEESAGSSDLQKDIARWKVKVMSWRERGANAKQIAAKLDIGEFLVSRILEMES